MHVRRRSVLGTGSAIAASLSGCLSALSSTGDSFDMSLFNYTDEPQPLKLELLSEGRGGEDTRALDTEYTIPAPTGDDSAGSIRKPDFVPQKRYLLRVLLHNGRGQWHHTHVYPDRTDTIIVRVYRDSGTGNLYVRFT